MTDGLTILPDVHHAVEVVHLDGDASLTTEGKARCVGDECSRSALAGPVVGCGDRSAWTNLLFSIARQGT